jgi:hypothetical protein
MTATSRGLSLRFENVSRIRCLVEAVLMPERMNERHVRGIQPYLGRQCGIGFID